MKKHAKKLVLAKETLHELTLCDLKDAAGGTECSYVGCSPWARLARFTSALCSSI